MTVLSQILQAKNQHVPLLAILLDPDKADRCAAALPHLKNAELVLVGGSTGSNTDACIQQIRQFTKAPIILFPGNIAQFSSNADALLFLTLLNAQVPEVLIYPHIQVAQQVISSGIESIPMGYILIDGERKSSVEMATNCHPIPQTELQRIVDTALAGQLLGKQLIYLEAGSGALKTVSTAIIRAVRQQLCTPLIVGGGIDTPQAMIETFQAGADVVVIGNHFEKNPDEINDFIRIKREVYGG